MVAPTDCLISANFSPEPSQARKNSGRNARGITQHIGDRETLQTFTNFTRALGCLRAKFPTFWSWLLRASSPIACLPQQPYRGESCEN